MANETITLIGIIEKTDLHETDLEGFRLCVLIRSLVDDCLYSTFIERDSHKSDEFVHLKQLYELLNDYRFTRETVRVTLVKEENKEDLPLYRVVKQYQLVEEEP